MHHSYKKSLKKQSLTTYDYLLLQPPTPFFLPEIWRKALKNGTPNNSQFKAPLKQMILIEHLCLYNSCLSRNPEIKTVSLETAQNLLHKKKCLRNQVGSHKQITNYMTLPLASSLQMKNKVVCPLLILKLKSTLCSLPLLKWPVFYVE